MAYNLLVTLPAIKPSQCIHAHNKNEFITWILLHKLPETSNRMEYVLGYNPQTWLIPHRQLCHCHTVCIGNHPLLMPGMSVYKQPYFIEPTNLFSRTRHLDMTPVNRIKRTGKQANLQPLRLNGAVI